MKHTIFLGTIKDWGQIYIDKHVWSCNWYWGFGYLGNKSCHFHISSLINQPEKYDPDWTDVSKQFDTTWITQDQWWIIRDLFSQAYAFQKAADCYMYGGHQTDAAKPYRVISKRRAEAINRDLEKLLNTMWALLAEWSDTK